MSKFIEIEIENKSYIKLLDLEEQQTNKLKLTTLKDNQSAVIIKVFLNKLDERFLIKEFNVHNLKPKVSGIPRFELLSSYNNKILNLELKVDGRKVENTEIKLASYFRNKLLPLFILLGLLAVFLLFAGGKWVFSNFLFNDSAVTVTRNKAEAVKTEIVYDKPIPSTTNTEAEKAIDEPIQSDTKTETVTEKAAPVPVKNPKDSSETINSSAEVVKELETTMHTAYFTPNNTSIQKDAANILKGLARELINKPNALVEISGYCAMTGTEEGRERLSKERAYNALDYLKKEGWKPETAPVVKWYGGARPVTLNEDEIYRNRRVEINVIIP
ncbi:MAG: OmpA family protein [Spirochaetales bacterium]|nr:OmpA family protein [Spirochaetales bacterium]